jgi:hypothetical protein
MPILDRFRAQPRQKHPDPAVRLSFVQEIPIDEHDLLSEIARDDEDARVRRAAAAKLMNPAALAAIARDDADESVRSQATAMLRDIALEAFEGVGEAESLAAIDALTDAKMLLTVAKTASRETTAARAADRVTDAHALGSIARVAAHESVRRQAFERLNDPHEILAIALNSDFKDPATDAVDRFSDRKTLDEIAVRAKNRNVSKRARTLLREIDDRAAQEAAAAAAEADAAAQAAHAAAIAEAAARTAREDAERAADAARARAAQAESLRAEEEAAAERRAEQDAAERAQKEADAELARKEADRRRSRLAELITAAETASANEDLGAARRGLAMARHEWKDVASGLEVDAELTGRFAAAEARVTARDTAAQDEDRRTRKEALDRLLQLATRVEPLAARGDLMLKPAERALRDLRAALTSIPPLPSRRDYEGIVHRLKAAQAALIPKVQELRDVADWQRWANVGIQEQLCEKMEALKAVEDPEAIARQVRELQQQWRQAADVPRAQGESLWRRFKAAHDEVWARCEAHFAAQAESRADNFAKKQALAERAEALAESTRWIQTADEIKKLQAEWKTIGAVTRGQEKIVWDRFRAACDRFFTRRHADLAERKTVWAQNLAKKEELCVRAEAVAESTDWEPAAAEIKKLQAEWKTIGPVKKTRAEAIWQRFRAACDHFFVRYAQRYDIAREERVAAREAIVSELEALAPPPPAPDAASASQAPDPTAEPATASASQAPDPTAEPATASTSQAPDPTAEPATASAVQTPAEPPADLLPTVRSLRGKWQQELALRGVDRERAAALDQRFAAAFAGVVARWPAVFDGTDLDPDANRKRMEALVKRMEDLAKSVAGPAAALGDEAVSPTTRLAAMLKDALASNTIGGKVDEDSRFRAAVEDVRQAQAAWSRIGPVPEDARRPLADRFQKAVRLISERAGKAGGAGGSGKAGWAGKAGR